MKFLTSIVGFAALASTATSTPLEVRQFPAGVRTPTDDPFYVAPSSLSSSRPGTILRSRSIGSLNGGLTVKSAYQLMFRSTDSLGKPSAAISTILVPRNANYSRIISYQFAEDAAWLNCAPSYLIQTGSTPLNAGTNIFENGYVGDLLDKGYIVNVPDYEGLTSAFTSGLQAGHATLDSIRAALNSGSMTGITSNAEYQMWGYSGGSLASEWASELQPSYAPELRNFKGTALGGLVPNITSVLVTINQTPYAGLIAGGILGIASAYPDLEEFLNQEIKEDMAADFKKARSQCLVADIVQFANKDIADYFKGGINGLYNPAVQKVVAETGIQGTHGTPKMPVYAYKGVRDQVSPIGDSDALIDKLCSQGARIEYIRILADDHISAAPDGAAGAMSFIDDMFNGVVVPKGCKTSTN